MKTTQTWGWLAAGVLAAGLNAAYHDGGLEWARRAVDRVVERSQVVMALATGRADRLLAEVRVLTAEDEAASDRANAVLTRAQQNVDEQVMDKALANMQARVDREVARCQARRDVIAARRQARLDLMQAHMNERLALRTARLNMAVAAVDRAQACERVRVRVPRLPVIKIPTVPAAPEIHIQAPSAGPV